MAEQNMDAANETYAGFIGLVKIGTVSTLILTAIVVALIAS